jgi:hypothetical protein
MSFLSSTFHSVNYLADIILSLWMTSSILQPTVLSPSLGFIIETLPHLGVPVVGSNDLQMPLKRRLPLLLGLVPFLSKSQTIALHVLPRATELSQRRRPPSQEEYRWLSNKGSHLVNPPFPLPGTISPFSCPGHKAMAGIGIIFCER